MGKYLSLSLDLMAPVTLSMSLSVCSYAIGAGRLTVLIDQSQELHLAPTFWSF